MTLRDYESQGPLRRATVEHRRPDDPDRWTTGHPAAVEATDLTLSASSSEAAGSPLTKRFDGPADSRCPVLQRRWEVWRLTGGFVHGNHSIVLNVLELNLAKTVGWGDDRYEAKAHLDCGLPGHQRDCLHTVTFLPPTLARIATSGDGF